MAEYCSKCSDRLGFEFDTFYEGEFCEGCGVIATTTESKPENPILKNVLYTVVYAVIVSTILYRFFYR